MQAEYLKRRFEIKDDLHRMLSSVELSRSLKTEEKEVKDGPNQIEVKGYDKQTFSIEYKVSGQWGTAPYIEYLEWKRLEGKKGPILRGRDIKRYSYEYADLYLIATFPAKHYDIEKYPAVKDYLLSFGMERLEQTGKEHTIKGEKIKARKKTNNKWFETQDSISYWGALVKQNDAIKTHTTGGMSANDVGTFGGTDGGFAGGNFTSGNIKGTYVRTFDGNGKYPHLYKYTINVSHNHTYNGDVETRPQNYTVRIWVRIS